MTGYSDFEKAAALFWALGGTIPHEPQLEDWARKIVEQSVSRDAALKQAVQLCGKPDSPGQRYLLTKLYSWMGAAFAQETIRCASAYLSGEPWNRLPRGMVRQEGILTGAESAVRASLFADMGQAQAQRGEISPALNSYGEAYRLEPYNAMYPIKIAELLLRTSGSEEAVQYLMNQRASVYYKPVKYQDARGERKENDTFRQLLEAQIRKLEAHRQSEAF